MALANQNIKEHIRMHYSVNSRLLVSHTRSNWHHLLYVEVSICSGSSLMSTSNLSCTFQTWETIVRPNPATWTATKLRAERHTWLRTSESEAEETKVIASPFVPKRPALPTWNGYFKPSSAKETREPAHIYINLKLPCANMYLLSLACHNL
jgi:hypothetical protein